MSQLNRFATLFLAGAAACSSTGIEPTPGAARTALPRALTNAEQNVLSSSNAFTFALWGQLNKSQNATNIFASPLSASFSLGMTMNGAAGQTLDDMRTGLQFGTTPVATIDTGYKSLIGLLTTLDPKVTMEIANSIWYRNTFSFNQSFLDAGKTFFDATVSPLNFADATGSLKTINGWVDTKTHGKITSILDAIHDDDVMFLINAIYFKGGWRNKFDPAQTQSAPFHSPTGDQTVSLMHKDDKFAYVETSAYQAIDLPYGDSAFTMTVVLPKTTSNVNDVAASLTAASWTTLTGSFHTSRVDFSLPKLTLAWEKDLIPDLQALGIRAPFVADGADFTGMSPLGKKLYISVVKQKAFVNVDEEGTEAAAVTVTGVTVTSAPVIQVMRVDRPFIFAIRERLSGTVLFMGKVVRLP